MFLFFSCISSSFCWFFARPVDFRPLFIERRLSWKNILPSCWLLISIFLHSWNSSHCRLNCKHRAQSFFFFFLLMYCSSNPSEPPSSAAQSRFRFSKTIWLKGALHFKLFKGLHCFSQPGLLRLYLTSIIFPLFFHLKFFFSSFLIFRINALNSAAFRQDSGSCGCHNQRWHKNQFIAPWIRASSTFMWCHISMNAESLPIA